ncbi:SEL1-like repeat protein [Henriciella mobilis]|uniref:Sel1 repeat family protein n=1 Tax=Henriciella mobilis TaxID=2305467 RepID=A0A399RS34_9PROT|nr:sel1 repeat family protein [Henriciella mobilis]RIJ13770.1 sel1 repeat family protein [Henriciella mobilis]RIJ21022.1 sel1 repeat family protein [Henriciella mobilis]RIJ32799.1 sel1 repeat family protein [Henriciella mobilis]
MPYSDMAVDVAPETGIGSNATGEELCRVGLAYSTGVGVDADMIAAHKWFNLAVLKGSEEAKEYRQQMADMLSSEEIKRALKSARDWLNLMN